MKHHPDRGKFEQELIAKGLRGLVGIDEVGRGCLAGPIYAAAVLLDYDALLQLPPKELDLFRDSKKLSRKQRQAIVPVIKNVALEYYICSSSVREIETLGIVGANFRAMRRTLRLFKKTPDLVFVDGNSQIPRYPGKQSAIVGGDSQVYSIAAASILAKESRDAYMKEKAKLYPNYHFDSNVGYGTKDHLAGIESHGICSLHRRNFAPISNLFETHDN